MRALRARRMVALAGMLTFGASAGVLMLPTVPAAAGSRPETYDGTAQAQAWRISVVKPAALPTSDELAGLGMPFAYAHADQSPIGRAIGSWLWPGEGVADVKSLLLLGLDPGADETACADRLAGRTTQRNLATPAVDHPVDGSPLVPRQELPVKDPMDNPCGSAGFKQFMAGQTNPKTGRREGGMIRALPDYPFWAHTLYPPNDPSNPRERDDARAACHAPGAFPPVWGFPSDACPERQPPQTTPLVGWGEAHSRADRNAAGALVTSFAPAGALVRAGGMSATATVEWRGTTLVSTSTVEVNDLQILAPGGTPFLSIDVLRSRADAYSDARPPAGRLTLSGVSVVLAGTPCTVSRPCRATIDRDGISVVDQGIPKEAQAAINDALDSAKTGLSPVVRVADIDAGAGLSAAGPAVLVDRDAHLAEVGGLTVELSSVSSLEGKTTVRLTFGAASAHAVGRFSPPLTFEPPGFVPPPSGDGAAPAPVFDAGPAPGPVSEPGTPPAAGRPARPAAAVMLASQPVPPGVVLLAVLGMMLGAGALVVAGIWETLF